MTLTEQLTEVCYMLQGYGYQFVVAGGFARDTALGVTPKDADIAVYGSAYGLIDGYGLPTSILEWALENGLTAQQIPSYGDGDSDFDRRLCGVAKIGDVDIIFYRDTGTWQTVVEHFDFNLNQFYFPSSVPTYSGRFDRDPQAYLAREYKPSFTANDVALHADPTVLRVGLAPVRLDYSMQREAYMQEKYAVLKPKLEAWLNEHYPL